MIRRIIFPLAVTFLMVMIIASITSAVAASNTVPPTRLSDTSQSITANNLKPPACAGLNLTSIWVCDKNNCKPTGTDVLVLGTDTTKRIDGSSVTGNSCCVGAPGTTINNCTVQVP